MAWQDDPVVTATAPRSSNPSDFYNRAYSAVLQAATDQGLENPEVIARLGAAQSSLETGYGKSAPGNNFFGIKGQGQTQRTREVVNGQDVMINDSFRAYNSLEDSANDYVKFLKDNPRYAKVVAAKTPDEAIAYQGRSGYATDPNYGPSLASIHSKYSNRPAAMVQQALNTVIPQAQAAPAKAGWMDDPVVDAPAPVKGGWMNDPVVGESNKAAEAPKKQSQTALGFLKDVGLGAADAITFGFADELYGSAASRLKGTNYKDEVNVARQAMNEAGPGKYVGLGATFLIPGVGVVRAANTAGRLGRAAAGAATGAIQGGLYGAGSAEGDLVDRAKGAAVGGTVGALTGGTIGALVPSSVKQEGNAIISKAGSDRAASMDAEIIRDINKVAANATQRDMPVGAVQLNALENKYIGDVNTALKAVGKKTLEQTGLKADDISTAIRDRRIIGEAELNALRNTKAGSALADSIEKAQRARSLTAAAPSSGGIMPLVREVNRWVLPDRLATPVNAVLGGRKTREAVAARMINPKMEAAAEDVLGRLGPSAATESLGNLQQMAQKAQQQVQTRAALQAQAKAEQVAQSRSEMLKSASELKMPRGGPLQEYLDRTGIAPSDSPEVLKFIESKYKGTNAGEAAAQLRRTTERVTNTQGFYDVQDVTKDLARRGILNEAGILKVPLSPSVQTFGGVSKQAAQIAGKKGSQISQTVWKMSEDEVKALAGRTTDTIGEPIENLKGYLTTRAARAFETAKKNPEMVPAEDRELLRALGVLK